MVLLCEGDNMSQPDAQTAPNYVTCLCQHCGEHIAFPSEAAGQTVKVVPTIKTKM